MSNDLATLFSGNMVAVEGLDDDTLAIAGGSTRLNKRISIKVDQGASVTVTLAASQKREPLFGVPSVRICSNSNCASTAPAGATA